MKTLIVNTGPSGDVLRTTVLLKVLNGEVYWLSKSGCADVLNSSRLKKVFFLDREVDSGLLRKMEFDKVISLNEERDALEAVRGIKTKRLTGAYLNDSEEVSYTPESKYWFDMSLVSRFGRQKADELKIKNKKSVPQIMVEMVGGEWTGQEYDLGIKPSKGVSGRIGMINIATGLWPNKNWAGYKELADKLREDGYSVEFLGMRPRIKDHINDINNCELVVCGDTLGLHIALALKKKVVGLFNCTSPDEIYDYGRLKRVISPRYKEFFYKKCFDERAVSAILVSKVYATVKKLLKG